MKPRDAASGRGHENPRRDAGHIRKRQAKRQLRRTDERNDGNEVRTDGHSHRIHGRGDGEADRENERYGKCGDETSNRRN